MKHIGRKLVAGGAWAAASKGLLTLTALAVNALLARLLSPDEIGTYFLLTSLVSALALLAQAGMHQAIVRLVAEAYATGSTLLVRSTIRSAYLMVAAITFLVCAAFASGAGEWITSRVFRLTLPDGMIFMASVWIASFAFRSLIAETFRGLSDIKSASVFEGLLEGLVFFCLLGCLYILFSHSSLQQVILLSILAACLSILVSGIILKRKTSIETTVTTGHKPGPGMIEIVATAWPLWITGIMLYGLAQTDLWIMGILRDQSEVGLYGAVKRLALLTVTPLLIANAVIPPLIATMNANKEHDDLEKVLRATSTVAAIPAFLVLALFISGAESLLDILYGEYYTKGASILVILSLGQLVNVWSGSCGYALMMTGHQVAMMKISIFCSALSVALALYLVPELGGLGAAISVSVALAAQNILMLFAVRHYLGIWTQIDIRLIWQQLSR